MTNTTKEPVITDDAKNVDKIQCACYNCGVVSRISVHEATYQNGQRLPYTDAECAVCGTDMDLTHQVNG